MKGFLGRPSARTWTFVGLFALALALRLANAATASLKLDDFHSLHHARAADLASFFGVLARDNHPPLSFALVAAARALFGESPWALRLPALAAGLATLCVLWRLGERLRDWRAQTAAAALLVVSSLHVELSSDVRMYALLALAAAGLLAALVACLEDGRGAPRVALWTFVGLHAHYHFVYTLVALVATSAALVLRVPRYRAAARPIALGLALAAVLALPWYGLVFPTQLAHGLAPGGSDATPMRLVEGWKNLVFLNVSVADGVLRGPGLFASALFLALAASGTWAALARGRTEERPALPVLAAAAAFGVPLLTFVAAQLSTRAGFEWRYLAAALPGLALLVGGEAAARGPAAGLRRGATLVVLATALALAVLNARDPGEEDYRDAVASILARAAPGDAVVAADWQPELFPHAIGWSYYAPRLAGGRALPALLDHDDAFGLRDPAALADHARVFCCLRSLPDTAGLLRALRASYPHEEKQVFGRSVFVHVFTRP